LCDTESRLAISPTLKTCKFDYVRVPNHPAHSLASKFFTEDELVNHARQLWSLRALKIQRRSECADWPIVAAVPVSIAPSIIALAAKRASRSQRSNWPLASKSHCSGSSVSLRQFQPAP
jgi:hypothetical protein